MGKYGIARRKLMEAIVTPNILFIMSDDHAAKAISAYGYGLNQTPNIDRIGQEGMRLNHCYVTNSICTPSRAAILTGTYNHVNCVYTLETGINNRLPNVAKHLQAGGYQTAIIGKWHLGDQPEFLPTRQGFDYYFGIPYSNDMGHDSRPQPYKYPPLPLLRMEQVIEEEPDQRYITQRYTREAIKWIKQHREDPFFLYLPHTMPHWPQYSSEGFAGKSKNGKWGDTVEEIDWSTGELLKALKELGIDGRTLVVFTSDNGGATHHGASNHPLKGSKGSTYEGGQRVPLVVRWPGRIPAGTSSSKMTTMMDFLPTFARLAGGDTPKDRKIDGRDIWPLLAGKSGARTPHEAFYYYFKGDLHAVRSGPWKLRVGDRPPRRQKGKPAPKQPKFPQLFHLEDDIAEAKNVVGKHPEVVGRLQKLIARARKDLGDGKQAGRNTRPAGFRQDARPLTSND